MHEEGHGGELLSATEREELVRVARRSLENHLERGQAGAFETDSPGLLRPAGAFVTLHLGQRLRGCIGTFAASSPLIDTVTRMAVAAAANDPRFPPLELQELPRVLLDISVLSPRWQATADDVVVGEHGLYVRRGPFHGVLLPQVASENGWDRVAFLAHTCLKAGLPADAWREPGTCIELFTAQVFGEEAERR